MLPMLSFVFPGKLNIGDRVQGTKAGVSTIAGKRGHY